jgi:hypothetical protein
LFWAFQLRARSYSRSNSARPAASSYAARVKLANQQDPRALLGNCANLKAIQIRDSDPVAG